MIHRISRYSLLFILLCLSLSSAAQRVGLVLSGGGAKGIAHIGVIKALEDNNIPIDYVSGTSMGAIVGSLYACGFSPDEMMAIITSKSFADWSSGKLNREKTYYLSAPQDNPQLFNINLSKPDSANIFSYIPANLISPMPMNLEFLKLFGPYSLQCNENFDQLMIPFRCVTSDIYHKHKIVCRSGSLGEAVRQSMSFPLVFKPIMRDGVLVFDGGIYDNFPVDVMKQDFNPDIIIGSNVSGPDAPPVPGNIYSQLEDMIIQNNDYSLPDSLGIKLDIPVKNFGVLDWDKANEIYDIGYKSAINMIDQIKARIPATRTPLEMLRRRKAFKSATPALRFDSIECNNANAAQSKYISYIFNPKDSASFGIDQAEDAYYRIVSTGMLSDLEPTLRTSPKCNILTLTPQINDKWNLGIGGWITSSTNSMLFLSGSYKTLRFNALNASFSAWLGQSYLAAMLDFKMELKHHTASYIRFTAVANRQKYYNDRHWFYQFNEPSFVTDHELYAKLSYYRALSRKTLTFASIGYCYDYVDYYEEGFRDNAQDKAQSRFKTLAASIGSKGSTLNHVMYPTQGWDFQLALSLLLQTTSWKNNTYNSTYSGRVKGLITADAVKYYPLTSGIVLGAQASASATLGSLENNYTSVLIGSQRFTPLPALQDYFNIKMRSPNHISIGLIPIWMPISNLQLRGNFYIYNPVRNLKAMPENGVKYHGWFGHTQFIGQVAAVYTLSKATISIYANYLTGQHRNWNFGINFGLLIPAPRFL